MIETRVWVPLIADGEAGTARYMERYRQRYDLPIALGGLIYSYPNSPGARLFQNEFGLPDDRVVLVDPHDFRRDNGKQDRTAYGERLIEVLSRFRTTRFSQNGHFYKTPDNVLELFEGVNQHPAPAHEIGGPGMYDIVPYAVARGFAHKVSRFVTYVSVHRVGSKIDAGAYLRLARVDFLPSDNDETVQAKGKAIEKIINAAWLYDAAFGLEAEMKVGNLLVRPGEESLMAEAIAEVREAYRQ